LSVIAMAHQTNGLATAMRVPVDPAFLVGEKDMESRA